MSVLVAASTIRTCLGDGPATFAALLAGAPGPVALRYADPAAIHVDRGYHVDDGPVERPLRASEWLTSCVADAVKEAGVDPHRQRVVALVGTGLRELRAVERAELDGIAVATERLHFADAVRAAVPVRAVHTIANACSAGGHVLALAQDMLAADAADVVVAAATDSMTESMLAMIGRITDEPARQVRPFDADRAGVLLGEGAAALVLVPDTGVPALARIRATGLSCDAVHETAPDGAGIRRAMVDAHGRAGITPDAVDLVIAHGTGTALNDPVEATVLADVFGRPGPRVTALKGALGHTSGASALHGVDIAIRCLRTGTVPSIAGLRSALPEVAGLRLVTAPETGVWPLVAQVDAFGFGGVNAVTVLAVAP